METEQAADVSGNLKPERTSEREERERKGEEERFGRMTYFEHVFNVLWGLTANEVKASGLVNMMFGGNESPEVVTERMTNSEFSDVASDLVGERIVIVSHY